MGAYVLERRAAAPSGAPVEAGITPKHLGNWPAGRRVVLRQRFANIYMDGTSAPLGSIAEGPYLRIRPEVSLSDIPDRLGVTSKLTKVAQVDSQVITSAALGAITIPQAYASWYYEINANGASVYLPFNASLEIVTGQSGMWVYDVLTFDDPNPNQEQQSRHRLTRNFYNEVTRALVIPVGCYAWEVSGSAAAASTYNIATEDTGKAAASGNSAYPMVAPTPGQIVSIGNGRTLTVAQVGALPAALQVHFHIQIP